jgi:hypothetical protein
MAKTEARGLREEIEALIAGTRADIESAREIIYEFAELVPAVESTEPMRSTKFWE